MNQPAAGFRAGARSAGLLLPLFSMPSSHSWGIGEFGDLARLAGWMRDAGLRLLQLLPLNEMAPGQRSPYSAISAMALDPIFLSVPEIPDFQALGADAMDTATRAMLEQVRGSAGVDHEAVRQLKDRALRAAFRRFVDIEWVPGSPRAAELKAFIGQQAWWLDDYALFRAAHHAADGRCWQEWPAPLRDRDAGGLSRLRRDLGLEVLFRQYLQWIAHAQWQAARARARANGVQVVGDFPFGVAADSSDVWAHQDLFSFEGAVGAPPDAFSDQGQNWQLPVYRWDVLRGRGYLLFAHRARRTADLFDLFRVDHVVGFFRTWVFPLDESRPHFVPADEPDQVAQGEAVLRILARAGAGILAEDLGTIPDFVRGALGALGIPGYKVMRWERLWKAPGQPFIAPASYPARSLATSGTHDTETLAAWWDTLEAGDREALLDAALHTGSKAYAAPDTRRQHVVHGLPAPSEVAGSPASGRRTPADPFVPGIRDTLLESLYASGSDLLTLPMQDIFGWTDRINVPALIDDINWTWKLPWLVDEFDRQPEAQERQATLRQWAERHRRLPPAAELGSDSISPGTGVRLDFPERA